MAKVGRKPLEKKDKKIVLSFRVRSKDVKVLKALVNKKMVELGYVLNKPQR